MLWGSFAASDAISSILGNGAWCLTALCGTLLQHELVPHHPY